MDAKKMMENELMDALSSVGCTKLPKAVDPAKTQGKVWMRAVAKVVMADGRISYAVVKNTFGSRPRVTRTFGRPAAIKEIRSLHPYEWLTDVPKFRNEEERTAFLAEAYGESEERIASLDADERERLLYACIAKRQECER